MQRTRKCETRSKDIFMGKPGNSKIQRKREVRGRNNI